MLRRGPLAAGPRPSRAAARKGLRYPSDLTDAEMGVDRATDPTGETRREVNLARS